MKTKYTSGPWYFEPQGIPEGRPRAHTIRTQKIAIAQTFDRDQALLALRGPLEPEDDARLIAAAPELFEALKAAEAHLSYCGYGDKWERECAEAQGLPKQIHAALAKVEG